MKEWLDRIRSSKMGLWLLVLVCWALAAGLARFPSSVSAGGMTEEESRISRTLQCIAGAGETRVSVYYAREAAFGSGGQAPIGAVIVARGARDIEVRLRLIRAAETLLGLSPGQVEVFPMEETP